MGKICRAFRLLWSVGLSNDRWADSRNWAKRIHRKNFRIVAGVSNDNLVRNKTENTFSLKARAELSWTWSDQKLPEEQIFVTIANIPRNYKNYRKLP